MSMNDAQQRFGFIFAIYFYRITGRSHAMCQSWDTLPAWRGKSIKVQLPAN
jgi:hypothetical protein